MKKVRAMFAAAHWQTLRLHAYNSQSAQYWYYGIIFDLQVRFCYCNIAIVLELKQLHLPVFLQILQAKCRQEKT